MSTVIFADVASPSGGPACVLEVAGQPVIARLCGQLRDVDVRVITRRVWTEAIRAAVPSAVAVVGYATADEAYRTLSQIAATAGQAPLLLLHGDQISHPWLLARLFGAPGTRVVVDDLPPDAHAPAVRVEGARVVAAASAIHAVAQPTGRSLGIVRVDGHDRSALGAVAEELRGLAATGDLDPRDGDLLAPMVVGLVRAGVPVRAHQRGSQPWMRVTDADDVGRAVAMLAATSEEEARMADAVKADDGFFTTFLVSPYSRYLARWAARFGLAPATVTVASFGWGLAAAAAFAVGTRPALVVGAVALQVAFLLDCVDGQLARYTGRTSATGAWLDAMFDRGKEYVVYAGLAVGAPGTGADAGVWTLAGVALALQTVRHHVDLSFGDWQDGSRAPDPRGPLTAVTTPAAGRPPGRAAIEGPASQGLAGLARAGVRASARTESRPALKWGKRILVLPIGERFALISIVAAVAGAIPTFAALIAWSALAGLYTLTGRLLRAGL
jgi:hypothetical protein